MNKTLVSLLSYAATVLITIVISMTSFWMMIGREFVTRNEAEVIVNQKIEAVDAKIKIANENSEKVGVVIQKNTDAIRSLEVQIAILNKTLELLEKRD